MKKILFVLLLSLSFFSCNEEETELFDPQLQAEREDAAIRQYLEENNLTAEVTEFGIYYIVEEEGTGTKNPEVGNEVSVNYIGTILYGNRFDNSYERGSPLDFTIGANEVVVGFDLAARQMVEGERTTFFIPSRYAYGANGVGGSIPPYATLIFEMRLEDIQ